MEHYKIKTVDKNWIVQLLEESTYEQINGSVLAIKAEQLFNKVDTKNSQNFDTLEHILFDTTKYLKKTEYLDIDTKVLLLTNFLVSKLLFLSGRIDIEKLYKMGHLDYMSGKFCVFGSKYLLGPILHPEQSVAYIIMFIFSNFYCSKLKIAIALSYI